jgi:Tfp pilus assembly protein PilN
MIKINLLRNRVQGEAGTQVISFDDTDNSQARSAIIKVLCMSLATVSLMLYESHHLSELRNETAALSNELQTLQTTVTQKVAEAEGLKSVEAEAKELEDKLKLLKHLSKLRLREVKTLDLLQNAIPERTWLKSLAYENNRFVFVGAAVSTPELSEFVKRLDESAYLSDVIVTRNREVGDANTGYRDFEFSAMVETQE